VDVVELVPDQRREFALDRVRRVLQEIEASEGVGQREPVLQVVRDLVQRRGHRQPGGTLREQGTDGGHVVVVPSRDEPEACRP